MDAAILLALIHDMQKEILLLRKKLKEVEFSPHPIDKGNPDGDS